MNKFFLLKHIFSYLNNFFIESESELMNFIKYELFCYLFKIKKYIEIWKSVKTAEIIYKLNNSVKNFDSV